MSDVPDEIENLAFCELLISCGFGGCAAVFDGCLDLPPTDPVDGCAKAAASQARAIGHAQSRSPEAPRWAAIGL